jgi:hypothetical protein
MRAKSMSLDILSNIFALSTFTIAPFYLLMVFFPRAEITRRIMQSIWSVAAPSLLTIGFGMVFVLSDSTVLPRFGSLMLSAAGTSAFRSYLQILNELPPSALVMWLHAIAADLVMTRWAYLESRELKLKTCPVSIAILLMGTNGPLGFIVYLVIRQLRLKCPEPLATT